jgi:hypothetical protein
MQDPVSDKPILRFLDRQVKERGYLQVIVTPVTALAAIGSALLFLGNDWLLFGTVVGGGTCILVLLLLAVEHMHASSLQLEVSNLGKQISEATADLEEKARQSAATIEKHSVEIKKLQELIESVRWITDRMAVCCSTIAMNGEGQRAPSVYADDVCQVSEFNDLQDVVRDYAFELLGPVRRLAIYYGDDKRLEPMRKSGWPKTNPRILVAGQPMAPLEVNAISLLDALKNHPAIYVPDLASPSEEQQPFVNIVPDHQAYRTLACFRIASLPSVQVESTERATLLGALLLQDARPRALENVFDQQFLIVLANALATGFLSVRLNLMKAGPN